MPRKFSPLRFLRRTPSSDSPQSVRGALFFTTIQQYTNFIVSFASIMILSRLLTPKEIGVYSVALTFLNVVHMLRDLGTSDYLVQVPELDNATARTAFTINLCIAWFLAIVLFFASPLLADFFSEPGLSTVLRILTLTFFLLPIGATINAILVREMEFALRFKINLFQVLVQNGLTVLLAFCGFGYYSLAWGAVAGMATAVCGCLFWAGHYRIRGVGLSQWRPVTHFGVQKTAETVMNQLGGAAPDFVIGRVLGLAEVGLFSRGYGLVRMFRQNVMGAVATVSYSTFARLYREGKDVSAPYLHSITLITGLGWPFLAFSSLMAYPVIHIFFGDQWEASVPILRFMAIAGAIGLTVIQFQTLLTSIGRVGLSSLCTAIMQSATIAMLVVTAFISLKAIAIGFIPVACAQAIAIATLIIRLTPATPAAYLRALLPSAIVTLAGLLPTLCIHNLLTPGPDAIWWPTIAAGLAMLSGCLIAGALIGHPLWIELRDFVVKRLGANRDRARDNADHAVD
ncbi:lipopolysaccharide biosynthesis protein [Salinisphaera sp. SPP-AMP-43]